MFFVLHIKIKILILYIICLILALVVPVLAAVVVVVLHVAPPPVVTLSADLVLALVAIFKAADEVRPFLSQIK
jgi:hypothetical protein